MPDIRTLRIKIWFILIVASQLAACTLVPGQHMAAFSTQSSVELPVTENNETILKRLNIQTIDAKLIVELEKDISNRSLGPNNVANHYFDYRIGSKTVKGTPDQESYSQYRVGPRDVLNITVWGHPELTIPAGEFRSAEAAGNVVGEDGTFFYPFAGVVQAAGRTVEEIRKELTQKLSHYIEKVQLDVRVAGYRSQRVYVVGEVAQPGVFLVKDIPLTVLEAINSAGGVNSAADLRNITLTRNDKTYSINLLSLYEGGDVAQNVLLQHGDVLNVPDNQFNKVFVLGETAMGRGFGVRPRSVIMNKARMTLVEALAEAGGMDQEVADAARVFVFRTGLGKSEIFHLDAKSPDALILADRFPLQPRDVIYVDRVEGIRWNQIIAQIAPTVQLLNIFDGSLRIQPFTASPVRPIP
ncbi:MULTISPECIES: polysaccharide export protein [Pseudomonadota]|uniref:polysaccharide export protein n=1 Tax=Pseudomonadota TaxID=1224 RepID=UPI002731A705|nr:MULTISPECIES: polysaccharide export protein [Pseudomonadota]MDP1788245.1 polysaccharide export protein [Nitrosomonas sp.]MDP2214316.1 polysaccharide export protein [Phenylobacterium sp.]